MSSLGGFPRGSVASDGSLRVLVTNPGGTTVTGNVLSIFDEAFAVASGSETLITSYAVPAGKTFFLQRIEVSGGNIATYNCYIDSLLEAKRRTWFNGNMSETFEFSSDPSNGLKVTTGKLIEVKADNFRPSAADFEARIHGILFDGII